MTDIPHFAYQFRLNPTGRSIVTNEQDSDSDILDCVQVLLSSELGERQDLPEYGLPEQIFKENGIDASAVEATVELWEPRAIASVTPEEIVAMAQKARVRIDRRPNA